MTVTGFRLDSDVRRALSRLAGVLLTAGLLLAAIGTSEAQFENKAMNIGSLHHMYNEVGGETEFWWNDYGYEWPAQYRQRGTLRANYRWLVRQNFTDANGEEWPVKITHVGGRATGAGEHFPQQFTTVSRIPSPEVVVDGLPSIRKVPDVDEVDPEMKFDRKIVNTVHSRTGITLDRTIYAFSQEHHDNYHIIEYTLTNTGHTDGDGEVEVGDQVAEGVYLHLGERTGYSQGYAPGNGWGEDVMQDVVGDGVQQYETDLRARYSWLGNAPGAPFDPGGAPILDDDHGFTQPGDDARLVAARISGASTIHAPATPGGPDANNVSSTSADELQPSVTGHIAADHALHGGNSHTNREKMSREFEMLSGGWAEAEHGHMFPHHADLQDADGDFTTVTDQGDPGNTGHGTGGMMSMASYGPYTLEPGESVTIVEVMGADGLNRQESVWVGEQWKDAVEETGDNFTTQPFSIPSRPDLQLSKNEWWMSGVDSLYQTFHKAGAAWEAGSAPPRAPLPPSRFEVTSGVGSIDLQWTPMDGGPTRANWEVYRSQRDWEGDARDDFQYERVATLPPDATSYEDTDVQRGLQYYYYIQAVGEPADNDGSVMTRPGPLRSNRQYTQTYTAASLKRPPSDLSEASIVPNPYVIGAEESVAWAEQDRIAFLDIPGQATIRIYTESGELVKTIEHTDGSGDDFWKLQTEDRQLIASGVYLAVITNNETGEQVVKKFSVIR